MWISTAFCLGKNLTLLLFSLRPGPVMHDNVLWLIRSSQKDTESQEFSNPATKIGEEPLSEWSNGYGSYYLIGKFGGTCNQLNSGNVYWFEETYRIAGVLGPYKVSLGKYSSSYDSYSDGLTQRLIYPNSYPYNPVNGTKGYLKTSQWYWLNSKIRIATVMYNYETGMYVSTGNYYEPEQGNIFSVPVASCEYTYH